MAVYDFLHKVMVNVDRTNPVCTIFCDMTQAFDYVRHDILMNKLEAYGIRGNVLKLIKTYLDKRKQVTEISRINIKTKCEEIFHSHEQIVKYGVPQGSVMGPPLFIVYINDLPKHVDQPVTLFADDSTITIQCNSKDSYNNDINNSLTSIINWMNNNNLKINLNKTNLMHFSQRLSTTTDLNVQYNNIIIREVDNTKFLGVTIDKKLNWKAHIEELSKKISNSCYALFKLVPVLNIESLLSAYHGLVSSHLRYGIIFWGNSTDKDIPFKAQKRCIRTMFKIQSTESCKPYLKKYKILTLPSLYILEIVVFVKSNRHLFPRQSEVVDRNHSRRDDSIICLHSSKTALMHKSVFCMAPKVFNKLPNSWKELNVRQLKHKLKILLEGKAYYSILEFLNDNI